MSAKDPTMTAARWNRIKRLSPPLPRPLHSDGTYNVGRNAGKRANRRADIAARVAARRAR